MMESVTISPFLRPTLSIYAPSTMAPIGRIKKPAPKTAKVIISDANSLLAGKNVWAM